MHSRNFTHPTLPLSLFIWFLFHLFLLSWLSLLNFFLYLLFISVVLFSFPSLTTPFSKYTLPTLPLPYFLFSPLFALPFSSPACLVLSLSHSQSFSLFIPTTTDPEGIPPKHAREKSRPYRHRRQHHGRNRRTRVERLLHEQIRCCRSPRKFTTRGPGSGKRRGPLHTDQSVQDRHGNVQRSNDQKVVSGNTFCLYFFPYMYMYIEHVYARQVVYSLIVRNTESLPNRQIQTQPAV